MEQEVLEPTPVCFLLQEDRMQKEMSEYSLPEP